MTIYSGIYRASVLIPSLGIYEACWVSASAPYKQKSGKILIKVLPTYCNIYLGYVDSENVFFDDWNRALESRGLKNVPSSSNTFSRLPFVRRTPCQYRSIFRTFENLFDFSISNKYWTLRNVDVYSDNRISVSQILDSYLFSDSSEVCEDLDLIPF